MAAHSTANSLCTHINQMVITGSVGEGSGSVSGLDWMLRPHNPIKIDATHILCCQFIHSNRLPQLYYIIHSTTGSKYPTQPMAMTISSQSNTTISSSGQVLLLSPIPSVSVVSFNLVMNILLTYWSFSWNSCCKSIKRDTYRVIGGRTEMRFIRWHGRRNSKGIQQKRLRTSLRLEFDQLNGTITSNNEILLHLSGSIDGIINLSH